MKNTFLYILLITSLGIYSQEKDKDLPKANKDFAAKNYSTAEAGYRISASNNPKKAIANYNLGNAIYNQKYAPEAQLAFEKAAKISKNHPEKHNAFHNLGNSLMLQKNYEAAVEAYKNALRNNPDDEETRYNYALAKKMKKDNPDKNKDKKKDKAKDKKDDKKDEPKKPDPKPDKKPEPKPQSAASKEQLKNLLDAVNNEEKKVQAKVNKDKTKGKPVQTDKDW